MFGWITCCALVLMIPFWFFSHELVYVLFGEEYQASERIFRILIWSLPFILMNEGIKAWLVITGKTMFYIIATGSTIILIIMGNLLFTPIYELEGAGYVFIIS